MKTHKRKAQIALLQFWVIGLIIFLLGMQGLGIAQDLRNADKETMQKDLVMQKIHIVKYLLKKVQWPEGVLAANVNLCVIGEDETYGSLLAMDGRSYNNHFVKVRKVTNIKAKAVKSDCQFVYVCASEAKNIDQIIYVFKKRPILLLADVENFAEHGGTMNFSKIKDQIALTINMESMESASLKMELKEFDEITVVPSLKDVMETH